MALSSTARGGDAATLAKAAVVLGVLAIVAFFGLGFAFDGFWFLLAFVLGLLAIAAGWAARGRPDPGQRRTATIGMVLGAIPVVWFLAYWIVVAVS